jgi:hypothetical protein
MTSSKLSIQTDLISNSNEINVSTASSSRFSFLYSAIFFLLKDNHTDLLISSLNSHNSSFIVRIDASIFSSFVRVFQAILL